MVRASSSYARCSSDASAGVQIQRLLVNRIVPSALVRSWGHEARGCQPAAGVMNLFTTAGVSRLPWLCFLNLSRLS